MRLHHARGGPWGILRPLPAPAVRLFVLALRLPVAASAQAHIGIGGRINAPSDAIPTFDNERTPGTPVTLSVPIDFSETVRVEPILGLARRSFESGTFELTTTATTLGVIVSALVPTDGVTLTPGVRVRYTRVSAEPRGGVNAFRSAVDALGIGPLAGGEYRFSERFRLGAGAGLEYQSFDVSDELQEARGVDTRASAIQTTAAVSVRFFL